jgi:hypothetical protein
VSNLGKRNLSGYLSMITVVKEINSDDVSNKTSTAILYRMSYYVCPVLGAEIDYYICHVCLPVRPSVRPPERIKQISST